MEAIDELTHLAARLDADSVNALVHIAKVMADRQREVDVACERALVNAVAECK
jgi:hypothetical protein